MTWHLKNSYATRVTKRKNLKEFKFHYPALGKLAKLKLHLLLDVDKSLSIAYIIEFQISGFANIKLRESDHSDPGRYIKFCEYFHPAGSKSMTGQLLKWSSTIGLFFWEMQVNDLQDL